MMKITYTTANQRMVFEIEVETQKQAFAVVSSIQELFEEPNCGECESKNIRPIVRHTKDDHTYYELRCLDCDAKLDFGQYKDNRRLFAKRHSDDTQERGNRGWYVYRIASGMGKPSPSSQKDVDDYQQTGDSVPF